MPLSLEYAGQVRDVVVAQLEDAARGLNAQLALTLAAAGLPVFAFDWSAASLNFFEAQVDPNDIETSTPMKYPICTLTVVNEDNTLDQTWITFSGTVPVEFVIYISFIQSGVPRNVEKTLNAVTAAVIRTFCDSSAAATANFTGPVTFNRKVRVTRPRLQMGAQNWRAPLKFSMVFQLDTN
jgi:hypothetical protein